MRKFQRGPEPGFLAAIWEKWGLEWEILKKANPGARFHWRQIANEPVNQMLVPLLKAQTQDHCSFCDAFPVSPPSIETIEHFRPKSHFPREAYCWVNLYFCCMHCQQKSDAYFDTLLRPDSTDYDFERYFRWDFTLGTIEVNEMASPEDQDRARATIAVFRLNIHHPGLRRRELRKRAQGREDPLEDFAYRNFVESR